MAGLTSAVSRQLMSGLLLNRTFHVGLHTGDPSFTPELDVPRHPITFSDLASHFASNETVEFPNLPPAGNITHWAVYDHPQSGRGSMIFSESFTQPVPVLGGETLRLSPGAIVVM